MQNDRSRRIRNFTPRSIAGSLQRARNPTCRLVCFTIIARLRPLRADTRQPTRNSTGISLGVSLDQTPFTLSNSTQLARWMFASLSFLLSVLLLPRPAWLAVCRLAEVSRRRSKSRSPASRTFSATNVVTQRTMTREWLQNSLQSRRYRRRYSGGQGSGVHRTANFYTNSYFCIEVRNWYATVSDRMEYDKTVLLVEFVNLYTSCYYPNQNE